MGYGSPRVEGLTKVSVYRNLKGFFRDFYFGNHSLHHSLKLETGSGKILPRETPKQEPDTLDTWNFILVSCQIFVCWWSTESGAIKLTLQGSTLIFKVTCPFGQVRFEIHLSCMRCHLSTNPNPGRNMGIVQFCATIFDFSPVPSDKWHCKTTCPRSHFQYFYLSWTVGQPLTHWGRVTHICVSKLIIIGSDNGLSPGRRQTIIWTNAGILLIRPLRTNFSEILIGVQTFSFRKMELKMSSAKWRQFVSASMS